MTYKQGENTFSFVITTELVFTKSIKARFETGCVRFSECLFISVLFIIAETQGTSNLPGNDVPMKVTNEILTVLMLLDQKLKNLASYCTARQLRNILKDQYPDLVVYVAISTVTLESV